MHGGIIRFIYFEKAKEGWNYRFYRHFFVF